MNTCPTDYSSPCIVCAGNVCLLQVSRLQRQHSIEDIIPDLARNTEAKLKVFVVVSEMVPLDFLEPLREPLVVHAE